MHIHPIYTISFIVITFLITNYFIKRFGSNKGCISYGYIGLIILSINFFTIFSWHAFFNAVKDSYSVITSEENYVATVIDYTTEVVYDSNQERYKTMYTPTVSFIIKEGKTIQRQLEFSTSDLEIGDTYQINYDKLNDKIITKGFTLFIRVIGTFLFFFIFTFLFIGEILYVLNKEMTSYYVIVKKVGVYFFIPFLMIGFDALLVYGIVYGNDVPILVSLLLVVFIFILTLSILGYFKMIFSKGTSEIKKIDLMGSIKKRN